MYISSEIKKETEENHITLFYPTCKANI